MPDFDTGIPHIARVYDYWLGGKDNFAADRELGERTMQAYPNLALSVRANRAFLARAVRFLAAEAGIRQFLDIGTGIPSADNTHEVAQRLAPASRIVYVDHDPIVLAHAKSLLTSTPEGATAYLDADLRGPDAILAAAADTLDFGQPVAVMLIAVMHFIGDDAEASAIVNRLTNACVPGSFLTISHAASDIDAEQMAEMIRRLNQSAAEKTTLRDRAGVARLFDGLDLVEPGVIRAAEWRPDSAEQAASPAALWAGVGRRRAALPACLAYANPRSSLGSLTPHVILGACCKQHGWTIDVVWGDCVISVLAGRPLPVLLAERSAYLRHGRG